MACVSVLVASTLCEGGLECATLVSDVSTVADGVNGGGGGGEVVTTIAVPICDRGTESSIEGDDAAGCSISKPCVSELVSETVAGHSTSALCVSTLTSETVCDGGLGWAPIASNVSVICSIDVDGGKRIASIGEAACDMGRLTSVETNDGVGWSAGVL